MNETDDLDRFLRVLVEAGEYERVDAVVRAELQKLRGEIQELIRRPELSESEYLIGLQRLARCDSMIAILDLRRRW